MKSRRSIATCAIAGLIASIAACTPGSGGASADGAVTIALTDDYNSLDPALTNSAPGYSVLMALYEPLVNLDNDDEVVPGLAESWEADATTLRFTLRDGVVCSDGSELTATHVKNSLERLADPDVGSPNRSRIFGTGDVSVTADDATREVVLENSVPFNDQLIGLAGPWAGITCGSGNEDPDTLDQNPTGTGAWAIEHESSTPGTVYVLSRRDDYTDHRSDVDLAEVPERITYRVMSRQTITNELLSGGIDLGEVGRADIETLEGNESLQQVALPTAGSRFILYNQREDATFAEADVRRAVAEMFDLSEVIQVGTHGYGEQAPSWMSSSVACAGGAEAALPSHDLELAASLLTDNGYEQGADGSWTRDGTPLNLRMLATDDDIQGAEYIASEIEEFGIGVSVDQRTLGEVLTLMRETDDWDFGVFPYGPPIATPSSAMAFLRSDGGNNFGDIRNEQFDEASEQAVSVDPDDPERCSQWEVAQRSLVENTDITPLWTLPAYWFGTGAFADVDAFRAQGGYSIDPLSMRLTQEE